MIPNLLWRCPLCATNDALIEKHRLLRPSQVHCTQCGTIWRVRRVIGDDYQLSIVASPSFENQVDVSQPLAQWYDRMKETIALTPITDPGIVLGENERLYLASHQVRLSVEADDPLFFGGSGDTRRNKLWVSRSQVGMGRAFLTNQRLTWQGEDGHKQAFSLHKLGSVYAAANMALVLLYEMRLYELRFLEESLLKWLTYFAYLAKEFEARTGHVITTSKY